MPEAATIEFTQPQPNTVASLAADLRALGLHSGMTVLVHSSLSRLGWVCGGPVAVVLALEAVLGRAGTLVMPAFSTGMSDPAHWQNPAVPAQWWEPIRATMPAFDATMTPTRHMGAIAECFRTQTGVRRSAHPQFSFAAWGQHAAFVTAGHALANSLGEQSPLARIYALGGSVLLLGVGHANNTSLHLAEHRADYTAKTFMPTASPMLVDGQREWVRFLDLDFDDEDFPQLGADFARDSGLEQRGQVGTGSALLMPQRALVDYGVAWLQRYRGAQ